MYGTSHDTNLTMYWELMMKKLSWHYKKLIFFFKRRINLDKKIKYKTLDNLFNYFGTDKGTKNPDDLNPNEFGHGFAESYEKHLNKFKNEKINFLEIGTSEGASLASFTQYFSNANIYGIDRNFKLKYKSKRIFFFNCDTKNKKDLEKFKKKIQKNNFKIIIDDASHILKEIINNLRFFFPLVAKDGYYIIEDFNQPENLYGIDRNSYLDDDRSEIFFKNIIQSIKDKKFFKSKILTKEDQMYLFDSIKYINVYKGKMVDEQGKNVSDIVFFKKK